MTKSILNCSNVKASTLIYLPGSFNRSIFTVTNSQYSRQETIQLNPVPAEIHEDLLEESICKALSLTGVNIVPEDLHACHSMKRSDRVIVKFKCRKQKQSLIYKCKNLGTKSEELTNLKSSGRLFVSKSMSHENQQLAYKCRQLKSARKIRSTWFFSNVVNIKLTEHGRRHKIFHVTDIESLLEIDSLKEYMNNASFFNLINQSNKYSSKKISNK